jgi:hypothetical protein
VNVTSGQAAFEIIADRAHRADGTDGVRQ